MDQIEALLLRTPSLAERLLAEVLKRHAPAAAAAEQAKARNAAAQGENDEEKSARLLLEERRSMRYFQMLRSFEVVARRALGR